MDKARDEQGQASVELVATLPFVGLVLAVLLQAAVAGQALWLAQSAARAAAREVAIGGDPARGARSRLPQRLEDRLSVVREAEGVRVRVRIPSLVGGDLGSAGGYARMAPQR